MLNPYLAHLIGDYLIQNDWMAKNKKISSVICVIHSSVYILPFLFCGLKWWQLLAIASQHFVQDRSNFILWLMKIKGSGEFAQSPMAPWSIIVTDNIIHILFIAIICALGSVLI